MRTHYSYKGGDPLELIEPREQRSLPDMKPQGFWYGIDGDWERWCKDEEMSWIDGPRYEITLGAESILMLVSSEAILEFSKEFMGTEHPVLRSLPSMKMFIDWPAVAKRWDGIEIAPYDWNLRLDHRVSWYYGWDCASGCIWRPKGVTAKPVKA